MFSVDLGNLSLIFQAVWRWNYTRFESVNVCAAEFCIQTLSIVEYLLFTVYYITILITLWVSVLLRLTEQISLPFVRVYTIMIFLADHNHRSVNWNKPITVHQSEHVREKYIFFKYLVFYPSHICFHTCLNQSAGPNLGQIQKNVLTFMVAGEKIGKGTKDRQ